MPASPPTNTRMYSHVKIGVGVLLSGVLTWWIIDMADLPEVLHRLACISPAAIILTVLLGYLAIPLRVVQWQLLLGKPPEATFVRVLNATCAGHLGNLLLPMRGGEIVRAYLLARDSGLPMGRLLVSVFLSRVQDILPIGLLAGVVFYVVPISPAALERTAEILGIAVPNIPHGVESVFQALGVAAMGSACLLLTAYFCFVTMGERLGANHPLHGLKKFRCVTAFFHGIATGIQVLGRGRIFWGAQFLSILCWIVYALSPIPVLMAFSMSFTQAVFAATAKAAITTGASILPSAPGAIGTFHALCLLSLLIVNPTIDKDAALAYVFVAHLISAFSPALPAIAMLPLTWKGLTHIGRQHHRSTLKSAPE